MIRGSSLQFLIPWKRRHLINMFFTCYNKVEVGTYPSSGHHADNSSGGRMINYIKLYFICVTYGFRSFHFVSFLYVFFFSFSFSFVSFLFSLFCFRFFAFRFFRFFSLLFSLFSFRFFFFPFLFVSFRFFPFLSLQVPCQAGWVSSVFTFVYIGVLQGHLLIVGHFYIFLTVFSTFLITDYLFYDLLLGSVFPTNNYNNLH